MKRKISKTRNKFELRIEDEFRKQKVKAQYEPERIPYTYSGKYKYDFSFITKNGKKICVECKGYLRPEHKRVLSSVKKCHPELDLRILFYANVKKQVKWAQKNKFIYAIGSIPQEWLDE